MVKIIVLAKAYPPVVGGVETYSEEIVRAYLQKGHDVTVVTQTKGEKGWGQKNYPEGVVSLFNTGPGGQATIFCEFLKELRKLFKTGEFDLIHATTWRPAIALLPWHKGKMVVTVHGREVLNYPFFLKPLMIKVLQVASQVVTVSSATMEIAREALFGREPQGFWHVAYNGISFPKAARENDRAIESQTDGPISILTVARHVPRKNIDGCIRALAQMRDEGLDFEYRIVGRGPMHESLKQLVEELEMGTRISFLGFVPDEDLPGLYRQSDLFLHPQTNVGDGIDFEGFGLVIADAMSFGCATLAGEAGGPSDFVRDGETGVLVNGLNQEEVTDAIRRLICDPDLRRNLSQNGREQALRDFSWSRHVNLILKNTEKKFNGHQSNR